jgi:hypothetical protein
MWLHRLGARVTGYALPPPTDPSLYEMAGVDSLVDSHIADVRDLPALQRALRAAQPEIVIHMAAQSLVRYSYDHPVETFATNALGTVHVLEAVRHGLGLPRDVPPRRAGSLQRQQGLCRIGRHRLPELVLRSRTHSRLRGGGQCSRRERDRWGRLGPGQARA